MFDRLSGAVADEMFPGDIALDLSEEHETDDSDASDDDDGDASGNNHDDDDFKPQARKRLKSRDEFEKDPSSSNIKVLKCTNKNCDDYDRVFKYASAKDRHDR